MSKDRPSLQLLKRPPEGVGAPDRRAPLWVNMLISGLALAACLIILVPEPGGFPRLAVGDTAPTDIVAPRDLTVPDQEATHAARARARARVPVVYDLSRQEMSRLEARIHDTFNSIRALRLKPPETAEPAPGVSELLRTRLGILPPESLEGIPASRFTRRMESELVRSLRRVLDRGVLLHREEVEGGPDSDLLIRIPGERRESYAKLRDVYDLGTAREAVADAAARVYPEDPQGRDLLAFLGQSLVFANLVENPQQTAMRREAEAARVAPLFQQVKKGEVIAAAGTPILHQHAAAMQAARRAVGPFALVQKGIGLTVLTALIFYVFFLDLKGVRSRVLREMPRLLLTALILVGTLAICRLSLFLLGAFTTGFESVDAAAIPFALPVAAGAMLVTLLLNIRTALVFSMMSSILMGLMVPEVPLFTLYGFIACLVGVFTVENCQRRGQIIRAGVWVGVVSALVAAGIGLQMAALSQPERLYDLAFAFIGGLLAAVVVSAVLPVLESVFNLPTNIRLLELSDLNHPLLRRLLEQAPGTYHHSMIMSNMAEQAAKAIGENALLARVGCYYHDIGKMLKPAYYIENQWGGNENLHDKLTPTMSRLVLVAHVKEGIELARQYNLPQEIIDVIPQHHGTRLINYFYHKAQQTPEAESSPPDEENFRYPGPRPQTKVAGIIMLADTVEASSRVLDDPSPARIATLVDQMVNTIFLDQQLDECELTLKDLRGIADAFGKALTGTFHHRIQYPGMQIPPTQPNADPPEHPPTALSS